MSVLARLGAILVAVLVVGAVGFLVIRAGGAEIGLGPGATATATPTAAETSTPSAEASVDPSAEPSVPSDAEALAILAEIEQQVIAIRGLEAADIGPAEIITRAELADELVRIFEEDYPPEEQRRDNLSLRAFGLLEADQDVAELQLELLGDRVLGFYDDNDKRMVVVSDTGLDVEARITYAHEYTHALQDAAYGLDSLQADEPGQDDRGLARVALIEGDANVTMLAWMFQHLTPEEIQDYLFGTEIPDTAGTPAWMVAQLSFPYNEGLNWALALAGGDPSNPDCTALDAAFAEPPASTEQIVDLDKWEARESPRVVEVPDLATVLGTGWEEVDNTPVGQASIDIMLEYLGVSAAEAGDAAEGWGGDRAVIVTGPDDGFAVAWRLGWDSAADATEFAEAYQIVVDGLDFPASVTELPNGEVLVAHASSEQLLDQTVDAAN